MTIRHLIARAVITAVVAGVPAGAWAQSLGIGPKVSLVRTGVPAAPASRLVGGTLRIMSSRHLALEGTLDYRAEYDDDRTTRVREVPIQGSLLLFPVRSVLSPYLLAGFGVYTRHVDALAAATVVETTTERRTGWHMGVGTELFLARRAAVFIDYRWRGGLDISHQGSMWNGGLAFYF